MKTSELPLFRKTSYAEFVKYVIGLYKIVFEKEDFTPSEDMEENPLVLNSIMIEIIKRMKEAFEAGTDDYTLTELMTFYESFNRIVIMQRMFDKAIEQYYEPKREEIIKKIKRIYDNSKY